MMKANKTTIMQLSPVRSQLRLDEIKALDRNRFDLEIFDHTVIHFFQALSSNILSNASINRVPAIVSLAFWLRQSHIKEIIAQNSHLAAGNIYTAPAGIVFHVCPSNVDTMFLYSLAISLLAGNKNVLRFSQRVSDPAIETLFMIINDLLHEEPFKLLQDYISVITYGHDEQVNEYFSEKADIRIIWGGDNTIHTFKSFNSNARIRDIAFANRVSCVIINTAFYLDADLKVHRDITTKFFNDAYSFDQKGCSSPQLMFLLGNSRDNKLFKETFYAQLLAYAQSNYRNDIVSVASMKLNALVADVIDNSHVQTATIENNYLYFIDLDQNNDTLHGSCGAGYFYLQEIKCLADIQKFIDRRLQTITYVGLTDKDKQQLLELAKGRGVDRIVPLGKALEFEYVWDGHNLLEQLIVKKWIL